MRIRWVKVWVDAMATLTERFRDEEGRVDFEALGREEYAFRHALVTGDFSRSERARDLYDATINEITSRSEAGRKGAEARWIRNTAAATTRDGVDESTNGCNNKGEGNTGSTVPAVRPESGKVYDLDKPTISAKSPAGAGVNLDSTQTISPDASSGNADGVNLHGSTITRNGSRAACTSATSGQTIEALEQPRAGEVPPESVSAKPSPALPVPAKRPHGEFGNVMLTDDEFVKLCERFGCADTVIEEADQYFEAQPAKKKKYKNHYAMLLNWCKRRETESKPQHGFKTSAEKQRDELQKIAEYYASKEVVG